MTIHSQSFFFFFQYLFSCQIEVRTTYPVCFQKPVQGHDTLFSSKKLCYHFRSYPSHTHWAMQHKAIDPRTRTRDPVNLHGTAHCHANPSACCCSTLLEQEWLCLCSTIPRRIRLFTKLINKYCCHLVKEHGTDKHLLYRSGQSALPQSHFLPKSPQSLLTQYILKVTREFWSTALLTVLFYSVGKITVTC